MLGAYIGDIVGSYYEKNNIKSKEFELFTDNDRFTDDSVLTAAIANASCKYYIDNDKNKFKKNCLLELKKMGLSHPYAGYGGTFIRWLFSNNSEPYGSYGNGSAMRVSSCGWVSNSLDETLELAKISAEITHNHPFGIAGAQAVASSIYLARIGTKKKEIRNYIQDNFYDLSFSIDSIRDNYTFNVTCQGSVPQAIVAFLDGNNFEDCIRNAISIGGDSDTIAAITGSIAEAYYGIPSEIVKKCIKYLDQDLLNSLQLFMNTMGSRYNTIEGNIDLFTENFKLK